MIEFNKETVQIATQLILDNGKIQEDKHEWVKEKMYELGHLDAFNQITGNNVELAESWEDRPEYNLMYALESQYHAKLLGYVIGTLTS